MIEERNTMTPEKEFSIVFDYEPQSKWVTAAWVMLVLVLIAVACAAGYYLPGGHIKELESEQARLNTELNTARSDNTALKTAYTELADKKLDQVNAEMKARLQKAEQDSRNYLAQGRDLAAKLDAAARNHNALAEKEAQMAAALAGTKVALERTAAQAAQLEQVRKELIAQLESMSQGLSERDKQIENIALDTKKITVDIENADREIKTKQGQIDYYKGEYEKIIYKYNIMRDKHLEEHPEQVTINWSESQIFTSPDGTYKILAETTNPNGKFINLSLGVYATQRAFPKFDMLLFDESGQQLKRVVNVDLLKNGLPDGRIVFFNQGWRPDKGEVPKYFEIRYPR
ncbi:MAG: hypothetical protein ABIF71_05715 [Planctomycetota bacterium]